MDELLTFADKLFTPEQQVALAISTISVMMLLQVFKNIYFYHRPSHGKAQRRAVLWTAAFIIGLVCGIAGFFVGEPPQPLWFWLFTGAASGGGAITVFKLVFEINWKENIANLFTKKG